jgi:hypothetical protein
MTTTLLVDKKCPHCDLVICIDEIISGFTSGSGLNHQPIGTNFISSSVLSCPRCDFSDYTSVFEYVKNRNKEDLVAYRGCFGSRENKIETLVKVAKKREKENKLKEALNLFLASSWYTKRDSPRYILSINKVLSLIMICFNKCQLSVAEERDLLNLGINICNQIGLDKTKNVFDDLNKIGKKRGMILI